jgi:two-component system sensor histidine kinase PilS (NtrC family)
MDQVENPQSRRTAEDTTGLNLFLAYRVFVATVMLVLFFGVGRGSLGAHSPTLFAPLVTAYAVLALGMLMFNLARPAPPRLLTGLSVGTDIVLLTLLMYASGGVTSGVGILIAISLALGANILASQAALALAATASLAVIGEEFLAQVFHLLPETAYVQAGLLGIAYFSLVGLVMALAARARRSEQLVQQRESELVDLAQLNDFVIQQMRSGIVVTGEDQVVQVMNESAWALLGMPPLMRHHPLEAVSPALNQACERWRRDPGLADQTLQIGAAKRDVQVRFQRLGQQGRHGTLITLEDVSRLTARAQQMKLASLGRLTGGIAHEVRNPLGAISHAAQLMQESGELAAEDRHMLEIILHNARRVNEVIETILRLSRQDLPKPKPLVLGPWLETLAQALRQACVLAPHQLVVQVEPEGTTVYADAGQLQQIIEVLCDNAVRHFGGRLEDVRIHLLAGITPESGGPFIEIQDNGPGIPQAQVDKLFEPFFTTRNEGTGLGLYIASQLSEANRIRLQYQAIPTGSCFRLSFPNPKRRELA